MFFLSFFHGDLLAGIFSSDSSVIAAAADYLKAYAIDCLLTAIFFCYTGFYNGIGRTRFVMIHALSGKKRLPPVNSLNIFLKQLANIRDNRSKQ
ncbi:MAG: MATE family efflux transporter [Lachnospiraceae bacterium]|mgnify:FL=1